MPSVLAVMAHPDDIESTCAGTLILLKQSGWEVHLATMTAGDLGSRTLPREEIAKVRRREAEASASLLGAGYTCLEFEDLTIALTEVSVRRVTGLIRDVRPDLILTHSPVDYMSDHEETARIVREAAFASTVPHWKASLNGTNGGPSPRRPPSPAKPATAWPRRSASGAEAGSGRGYGRAGGPCEKLPVILYGDAVENIDHFGRRLPASLVVDITEVIDLKERMLEAHESQRAWLRQQHGNGDYLKSMRRRGADRARDFRRKSVRFAEGFNQHLGPPFPKSDLLAEALGKVRVKSLEAKP